MQYEFHKYSQEIKPDDLVAYLIHWQEATNVKINDLTKSDFGAIMHDPRVDEEDRERVLEAMDAASLEYDDLCRDDADTRCKQNSRRQIILESLRPNKEFVNKS